ncbi:YjgH/F family protein - putative translation initiation inhibitor [Fervidicoccus fontis Kam940]|nr:Rid family detoxifying hydrolase [Fervidicoccus fontis]AFH42869.1 YjgH/F family protein - putative translation initiation inhibitor [Fervidicoccus fontis Kam940]
MRDEMLEKVQTDKAPKPVGPYSQGIVARKILCSEGKECSILFISGMIPVDPETGKPVEGGVEEQARRCLLNIKAVVEAAGGRLEDIAKVTVFLSDISNFDSFNKVYSEFFKDHKPARSVIGAKPPRGYEVEVEAIAVIYK